MEEKNTYVLDDKDSALDLLSSEKAIIGAYSTFLCESATPAVKRCFSSILSEEYKVQEELFAVMNKRGWYPVDGAEDKKIEQTKQKFVASVTG